MARRTIGVVVLALIVATYGASCSSSKTVNPAQTEPIKEARIGGTTPGSLLSAETLPGLDPSVAKAGIRAAKITYRSTNSDTGKPTVVSGTVFAPDRTAPKEGWRVVAIGHGSTGIDTDCAPSSRPTWADSSRRSSPWSSSAWLSR